MGYRDNYVDTVGRNRAKIAGYIRSQLNEDRLGGQLNIPYARLRASGNRNADVRPYMRLCRGGSARECALWHAGPEQGRELSERNAGSLLLRHVGFFPGISGRLAAQKGQRQSAAPL